MNTTSNKKWNLLVAVAAAAALMASVLASQGHARSLPAQSGHAGLLSDAGCFSEAWGSTRNNCAGSYRYWIIPLVIDPGGYYTPGVTVYASTPSNTVGCYAYGVSHTSTNWFTFWQSDTRYPGQFGVAQTLTPTGAYVPAGGYGMLVCMVYPGGQINGVVY